ncbi:dihydroxy-acid dehydratase domain-containing protein [Roseibium alexandrii]|uniref:Dihydroxy-acid dehydratase n=2 Tax=Roseibium alexandrii TaxID=388408 RepID=A0A0M7A8Z5_9HYPH|nr:dihydroxy-acid dehydratase [Roseibium alexandrii]EEE43379.2 Dihydroxyacid dehydratase/phosphogluconate dehydratase [Roseibium alexandrii DFL-11]CTQ71625.1 Dihydroxy-acid dehydratase [Roseibium alexandrii]
MTGSRIVLIDRHPGRSAQTIGVARELGTDPDLIHEPSVGVVGTKGDSQCYLGVARKVDAIHEHLKSRIGSGEGQLKYRLVQPEYTIATSDGIRNGTREMRYSLIGREVTNDGLCEHLEASGLAGTIAVVACDKPPVGTMAAVLERNEPAIIMSDGTIRPGKDPETGEMLDIVSAYQVAGHPDKAVRDRIACNACPGIGSCGGMFTYNTMQTFIGVVGLQPLHMVAPPSDDPRRLEEFPQQLVSYLADMMEKGLKPRDIVKRDSLRNAIIVAMAIGGSTNVVLHVPEIARAAGYEHFWRDVMTPEEFNHLSQHVVPVLTNARPYGKYSMLDIDRVGGVQVIVKELLDAGLLNGDMMTCTGRTLAEQVADLNAAAPDGDVIHSVAEPFKPTGGLRMLGGNLSPDFSAILKLAGVEGGLEDNLFKGRARVFEREAGLIQALDEAPDSFQDHDMVIVRYDGPSGGPGMPEMLDPTSRITTLCRERGIVIALMTDARFSGGSVGLVIGHVGPEAALGGPIAFVEDGDEIIVDLNKNTLDCPALDDAATLATRKAVWDKAVADNGGIHPNCGIADTRLLHRARHTAVPALRGGGLHPNREVWVRDQRLAEKSGFEPRNRHRSA